MQKWRRVWLTSNSGEFVFMNSKFLPFSNTKGTKEGEKYYRI